jgi:hypothetical protein
LRPLRAGALVEDYLWQVSFSSQGKPKEIGGCHESGCWPQVVGIRYAPAERFFFFLAVKFVLRCSLPPLSGTPVNTSLKDLKNQLEFIGIENVDKMFTVFFGTAFHHMNDQYMSKRWDNNVHGNDRVFGHFMFLLRCIMIRHTQRTQKYCGTTTTLMSLPPKVRNWILEIFLCIFSLI